jgi:hypothetical protein
MPFQNVQHISKNTHQTCQIFLFPLSFLPTGGGMSELVAFALFMSKLGGVNMKVMPPTTLEDPMSMQVHLLEPRVVQKDSQ